MSTKAKVDQPAQGAKPAPDQVMALLTEGNRRFFEGRPSHPHADKQRRQAAARANQGDHAVATVLTCSDSRVPVERIFDMGIMDLFVVRVAGSVIDEATAATIEYGMLHVHTPLLVVLGHSDCGAVTAAVRREREGKAPPEDNVLRLLDRIQPAARRALDALPQGPDGDALNLAVEENVWQSLRDLFAVSPAVRELAAQGQAKAVGAIYDLDHGEVRWLGLDKVARMLAQ